MPSAPIFTAQTFDLLTAIAHTPTAAFYHDHKAEFKLHVERPLQELMQRATVRLPIMLRDRMETKRNIFSRILKNDFGRGGAWDNYWGAFYPKGSRRVADCQLAVWMDRNRVGISFYINDYGALPRERFRQNCAQHRLILLDLLTPLVRNPLIQLARDGRTRIDDQGHLAPEQPMDWNEWLADPAQGDYWAFVSFRPADIISMPASELEDWIVQLHSDYFPLALLSIEADPLQQIEAYLA